MPRFKKAYPISIFKRAERILKFLKSRVSSGEAESLSVSLAEKSGNFSQAIALMDNIVEHKPEDLAVRTRRRSLLMASGRQERALESWRYEITRFDGNDPNFSGALFVGNYFAELKPEELAEHHKRWGKRSRKRTLKQN